MVLANYVKSFPVDPATGLPTITAENSPYGEVTGEGRIVVKCSHDVETTDVGNAVEATCTKEGYSGDKICALCQ